jgi:hypothetical protein
MWTTPLLLIDDQVSRNSLPMISRTAARDRRAIATGARLEVPYSRNGTYRTAFVALAVDVDSDCSVIAEPSDAPSAVGPLVGLPMERPPNWASAAIQAARDRPVRTGLRSIVDSNTDCIPCWTI